jgi:hypothetical protein
LAFGNFAALGICEDAVAAIATVATDSPVAAGASGAVRLELLSIEIVNELTSEKRSTLSSTTNVGVLAVPVPTDAVLDIDWERKCRGSGECQPSIAREKLNERGT